MNLPVLALSLLMAAPYTEADARAYMEAMRKDARRNMSVDPVDGAGASPSCWAGTPV